MTLEHTPPQLSPDGERLLAEVLGARANRSSSMIGEVNADAAPTRTHLDDRPVPDSLRIHPMTVLLPILIVFGGLGAAAIISFGIGDDTSRVDSVDVEVAGAVEQQVEAERSFVVQLASVETANNGIHRFDLRIDAPGESARVATDRFHIGAVDREGNPLTTIVRFASQDLEPGGDIEAMVRVEGADVPGNVVLITFDGVLIEQVSLD